VVQKGEAPHEMPFLDHLEELRVRIFWIVGALFVGMLVAFWVVVHFNVLEILQRPIRPYLGETAKLVVTGPGDQFKILMVTSLILGLILALPVILYQIWIFLSPGLYDHEKRVMIPVLIGASALFLAGVSFCFMVVMPLTFGFLLQVQKDAFTNMITADRYFGFATSMSLAFGAVFELPIVIIALTALGIVTPSMLVKYRRHAILGCAIVAAVITPPDALSMAALMVPLYVLYEVSVVLARVIFRRRERGIAEEEHTIRGLA
jgi:sec-independent protein translocase protein TatC